MARKIEEPTYRAITEDGSISIRQYPSCIVAETEVSGDWDSASTRGFRRLAGYIFGGNQGATRIAMTAPVGQRTAGTRIAMTAPVGVRSVGEAWVVSFTMPAGSSLTSLPTPNDALVVLRENPGRRVAVIRFTGFWSTPRMETKTAELRAWLTQKGLVQAGQPEINRYDPPWTLPWLRRNEIWIPVETDPVQMAKA